MSTTPPQDPYDPAYRPPPSPLPQPPEGGSDSSAAGGVTPPPGSYGPPAAAGHGQAPTPAGGYGQAPAAPGGYGAMPSVGGGAPAGVLPPRPSSVATFVYLMVAGAVLQVIGAVVGFLGFDEAVDEAVADPALDEAGIDGADLEAIIETTAVATLVVVTLVTVALWLLFAWFVSRGMGWARVVGTVLGGINGIFSLVALSGGGLSALINLLFLGIIVGGLVVLWLPTTSQWFQAVKQAKSGGLPA